MPATPKIIVDTPFNARIYDLEPPVLAKVENRTTESAAAGRWIRDALVEISNNPDYKDDFDQLEVLCDPFNLTAGQATYQFFDVLSFVDPIQYNIATLDIVLWVDYPNNTIRKKLQHGHYSETDKYLQMAGLPFEWYRFADTCNFNPTPAQPYQVQARILKRHPITDFNDITGSLGTTPILLPQEWYEIIQWAAAMRGFMELLEYEKANNIRSMLYGDPKHPDMPGMIESVKKRRKLEQFRETVGLRPIVGRYML